MTYKKTLSNLEIDLIRWIELYNCQFWLWCKWGRLSGRRPVWLLCDLSILEFIILSEKLQEYDVQSHVPSDIAIGQLYVSPESIRMQNYVNAINNWSQENLMKINRDKSNFIIFSRSKQNFTTRIAISEEKVERMSVIKLLGVWLQEDLGWNENTKQICKKAFSRISLLSKLKYVGIEIEDLLKIYKLFIRCIPEYCSTAFH